MRCLYCGKELALLKRLRGGGDFCSVAHKQSYQEEYNRLALSRLLQAQKKGQGGNNSAAGGAAPPPNSLVTLEEPVTGEAESPDEVEVEEAMGEHATAEPAAAPMVEVALGRALIAAAPEPAMDSGAVEEPSSGEAANTETPLSAEPEPVEPAGFLMESLALIAGPEATPRVEPWLELSPGPAMSEWQHQTGTFSLSQASLLSLDLQPQACSLDPSAIAEGSAPQAFASASPDRRALSTPKAKKAANTNRLAAGAPTALAVAPSVADWKADASLAEAIGFESTVVFDESQLLGLSHTSIDFPAEDASAMVPAGPSVPEQGAHAGDSPRESLAALSRLHQKLVEQEALRTEEVSIPGAPAKPDETAVTVVRAVSVEVVAPPPEAEPAESQPREPRTVEIAKEESTPEVKPVPSTELLALSIKTFPPPKAALQGGDAIPGHIAPLLPHLKSLPLRPKVALAPGYVPPTTASASTQTKPATPAATVPAPGSSKFTTGGKPSARLTQPKQPSPSTPKAPANATAAATAKATATTTAPEPAIPAPAKEVTAKADVSKPLPKPVASQSAQVPESGAKRPGVPEAAPKVPEERERTSKPEAARQAKPEAGQPKPEAGQPKPAAGQPKKDDVPSFGSAQPSGVSWLGSLKVKLGIAILLLVIACVYFLGWGGGKSRKPDTSNAGVSADGSGPSIIMGEGGWVEDWGGDPSGMHVGREITIYRPSLKLSDYRLEFQGSIDAKSVGWVFRAADPENYYAMKLALVSAGLSPKVALFKFLVVNGRQTQVGRVPIDLAVQSDMVFDIRVDVRGPQFTTYIQGQQVDSWTDDQLKVGGAGFLNEREERGKVKSVSIRYLSGAAK